MNWTPFLIDTNSYFGMIKSYGDWEVAVKELSTLPHFHGSVERARGYLLSAKRNDNQPEYTSFGLYYEFTGKETLADFFTANDMQSQP